MEPNDSRSALNSRLLEVLILRNFQVSEENFGKAVYQYITTLRKARMSLKGESQNVHEFWIQIIDELNAMEMMFQNATSEIVHMLFELEC